MVWIATVEDVTNIIHEKGIETFLQELIEVLSVDFSRWHEFEKVPRHATHLGHGVIELMPISADDYYAFKYVNGHPKNPLLDKQTVVAVGLLSDIKTGYPLLISEMTLLTAIRTAATSALATQYLARAEAKTIGLIGTGAQSEFQVLAHKVVRDIDLVKYYDIDDAAMQKFANNLAKFDIDLQACKSAEEAVVGSDIIITATAAKQQAKILENKWIQPGMHINGLGGDCPGKTELDLAILNRAKIVVEYYEQASKEGEIQHLENKDIYAELWELVTNKKAGRENENEITLFDSVGFALEDYSVLRYVYSLLDQYNFADKLHLIPRIDNPKDLFGLLV